MFTAGKHNVPLTLQMFGLWGFIFMKLKHDHKIHGGSQWLHGLGHEMSSPARMLGSWVRIPLKAWMFVCIYSVFVLSCLGSGLATGLSPPKESH
jgi:hypothetical protein